MPSDGSQLKQWCRPDRQTVIVRPPHLFVHRQSIAVVAIAPPSTVTLPLRLPLPPPLRRRAFHRCCHRRSHVAIVPLVAVTAFIVPSIAVMPSIAVRHSCHRCCCVAVAPSIAVAIVVIAVALLSLPSTAVKVAPSIAIDVMSLLQSPSSSPLHRSPLSCAAASSLSIADCVVDCCLVHLFGWAI